jgi:hypothetical protein
MLATTEQTKRNNPHVRLSQLHHAQAAVKSGAHRFNVICCGRRFGKTELGKHLISEPVIAGKPVAWFSPTYKMLSEVWRDIKFTLAPITSKPNEQEHRLELITGGIVDMWSLDNPDAARGRKYARIFIDEAAFIRYLEESWNNVIRPALSDLRGDAFFAGTPKGLNYFYNLWQLADSNPDWGRWRYPTSANPYIPADEVEAMRLMLPERVFKQEILAEFISDGSYFQGVDAAVVVTKPDDTGAHLGHHIFIGVDWALTEDFTVLTVGCQECNRVVDWERFNRIEFTYQRERLIAMAKRWRICGAMVERNSIGEPNIEIIREFMPIMPGPDGGAGFNTTASSKPMLIQRLAGAIEHGGLKIPHDYADELRVYQVEMGMAGHPKFAAPQGLHDDRVISLALLVWAFGNASPMIVQKSTRSKWIEQDAPDSGRWRQY